MLGLVEHGDLTASSAAWPWLDEVLEAAGAGDEDVDAGLQRLDLRLLTDPAEDRPAA